MLFHFCLEMTSITSWLQTSQQICTRLKGTSKKLKSLKAFRSKSMNLSFTMNQCQMQYLFVITKDNAILSSLICTKQKTIEGNHSNQRQEHYHQNQQLQKTQLQLSLLILLLPTQMLLVYLTHHICAQLPKVLKLPTILLPELVSEKLLLTISRKVSLIDLHWPLVIRTRT